MPIDIESSFANLKENVGNVLGEVDPISLAKGLTASLNKYVVSPLNAFGLGGFVFDVEGETTINLESEITDHYTEDNSAIQDHVALKPLRVTLNNYVGELVYRPEGEGNTALQQVTRKLTTISNYLPKLTAGAEQAKALYEGGTVGDIFSQKNLSSLSTLYGAVKDLIPPTERQAQAYMFFKALWEQKILTSVQTPYEYLPNMVVESITATQGEGSKYISDFSITLKQVRFVEISTVKFDASKYQSTAAAQAAPTVDGGKTQGTLPTINKSTAASLFDSGKGFGSLFGL